MKIDSQNQKLQLDKVKKELELYLNENKTLIQLNKVLNQENEDLSNQLNEQGMKNNEKISLIEQATQEKLEKISQINQNLHQKNEFLSQKIEQTQEESKFVESQHKIIEQLEQEKETVKIVVDLEKLCPRLSKEFIDYIGLKYTNSKFVCQTSNFQKFTEKILNKNTNPGKKVYEGIFNQKKVAIKELVLSEQALILLIENVLPYLFSVSHKNLVQYYAVNFQQEKSPEKNPWIIKVNLIMEQVYFDLYKLIFVPKYQKKLNQQQKLRILVDIMTGLSRLHQQNIVHLNLQLKNILVDLNLNLKIVNYSVTRLQALKKNEKGFIVGYSERYSAPELIFDNVIDIKNDIWSLGLLIYELFLEKQAWNQNPDNVPLFVKQVMGIAKKQFFQLNTKTGFEEIDNVIQSCLNFDLKQRPTVQEVLQIFTDLLK